MQDELGYVKSGVGYCGFSVRKPKDTQSKLSFCICVYVVFSSFPWYPGQAPEATVDAVVLLDGRI